MTDLATVPEPGDPLAQLLPVCDRSRYDPANAAAYRLQGRFARHLTDDNEI